VPSLSKLSSEFSRTQWRTLIILWVTYGSFYLCRVNVGPVRTEIQKDLAIGAVEMGVVLASLKIGYAIEGIHQQAARPRVQREPHGVHGEIAAA
jgi:sugar phosphate permease